MEEVKNIEVIDGILIDWSKFKSKATGIQLEQAKHSYINLCKLLYVKGHKLVGDYIKSRSFIKIDTGCGHKLVEITPSYYKTLKGNIKCSECKRIEEQSLLVLADKHIELKPIKTTVNNNYTIGFYNEKIDNKSKLHGCDRIFNDIEMLKMHLRNNDIVLLASTFSLFGTDRKEILELKEKYNIDFMIYGKEAETKETRCARLKTILKINDYIQNQEEIILKLLSK